MVAMNSEFGSLLPTTTMESDEGQDSFRGVYPEYGAIFMSSSAMKDECFKQGLFGLPSSQGQFLKQVKTGMILFLFEYERRELHGVCQACSDGEMNILPSAYNSSGKQFPAQVKVKPIWHCHPLSEPEFSGAIEDNYFSNWKFHFGLSKAQVRRLLMLFSSRKLKYQPRQRELSSKREPISVDTAGRVKEVDDGRSVLSDNANNELDADNHNGPAMTQSPGNVYENNGKEDGGMLASHKVGDLHKVDNSEGNVFGPAGPTENPAFLQSSLDRPVCPGMPVEETGSLIQDQTKSTSTVGLQITGHSCSASPSYRDAIVPATLPYDPDAFSLNNPLSPSIGVNQSSNSVQDCYKQHGIPSITNQSYTESKGINQSLESTSKFDVHVPIASPDHYEHSCQGNIVHFPEVAYSEEMAIDSSGKQCSREPVLKNSLSSESLSQIGSSGRETKSPSSYSLSPSNCLSFVIDRAHHIALQEKLEQEMAQKLNDEPCIAYVTSSDELQWQLQCSVHPDDHSSVDHRHQKSFDHDLKSYACSEGMCSDLKNQRSVFSRLTSDTPGKENSTHADYEETDNDASVDEVMAMLSASNYSWVKSKKSKRPTRRHGDEKFMSNKKTKVDSELGSNDLELIPKKSNMASATCVEDKVDQRREEIPFVDFKRRTELRKRNGDTKARARDEIVRKDRLLGGQCKRRKLIRPKFNDNEPRNEKSINGNICLNLQASSQESSVSEDVNGKRRKLVRPKFRVNEPCDDKSMNGNTSKILQVSSQKCSTSEESGSCEASIGSQGKLLPQGTDLSLVVCQSSHENENNQTERSSKYEREIEVESSAASVNFGDEGRKEPLCDVGSQIADPAIPKLLVQCTESSQVVHEGLKELLLDVGSQIANLAIPKLLPQCKESPQVVHQTSRDNENIEMERFPEYEQEIKTEISGPSLKVGDEGGMEPLHDLGSLAIP
ncbi:probable GPI-anchored adhesin-like protein PGA55 [Malus domestica]